MHATAPRLCAPAPAPAAPRPALRALPAPAPRRRLPTAATVALYAVGLTAGFLLVALASVPGGSEIVAGQLRLAALSATIGGLALLRARAVARRRPPTRGARAAM